MESGIDNRSNQVQEQTQLKNLNTSAIAFLDNLFWASDRFLDRLPNILKKADTFIEQLPATISDLHQKYPNLPAIIGYGTLSFITVYLSLAILSAIDGIPVLGTMFEWVGLAYGIWFGIRYLLFDRDRQELKLKLQAVTEKY